MQISENIEIPDVIPVMTLQETVLFPHAVMPLFIFESRYREMLADILKSHRLFAVFNEKPLEGDQDHEEPLADMGTVGIVRAAHENPDGTSNLALQGIVRVRFVEIVQESPYRLVRVEACQNEEPGKDEAPRELRKSILSMINRRPELTCGLPEEYIDFLKSLEEPAPFIDVAVHSICQNASVKQRLLETLSIQERYAIFEKFLTKENERLELYQKLQGETREDEIDLN